MPSVLYLQLSYDDYKSIETQMRQVPETVHTSVPGPFYHKSIRLQVNPSLIIEFHGPNVRGTDAEMPVG